MARGRECTRTDINFDPTTGKVEEHFAHLLKIRDFEVESGLGLSHRYALPSFFRAIRFALPRPPALKGQAARLLSSVPREATVKLSEMIGTGNGAITQRKHITSLDAVSWNGLEQ
jgi:hypothetical protein